RADKSALAMTKRGLSTISNYISHKDTPPTRARLVPKGGKTLRIQVTYYDTDYSLCHSHVMPEADPPVRATV
ncbi:MAG: hypothetical protein QME51_04140, partial [Planctomycetota bacterium]|nr:hypothetical protein [Planctomycetota bacterium]